MASARRDLHRMEIISLLQTSVQEIEALSDAIKAAIGPDSLVRDFYYLARKLAIAYAIVLPFELMWAKNRSQKILRPGFATDISHMLLTKVIGNYLLFVLGASFLFALMEQHLPLDGLRGAVRSQPLWLQVLEVLLLRDFIGYWLHRWMHTSALLWRAHACHHSSEQLDLLATVRVHPLQMLVNGLLGGVLPFALGFSVESLAILFVLLAYWGYFGHANIRIPAGGLAYRLLKPLRWIFVTPRFHHWHHCYDKHDVNFAVSFTFWDRLFGTAFYPEDHSWPERYGIPDKHPRTWPAQMVHPLLTRQWQQGLVDFEARLMRQDRRSITSSPVE
jgi:sterol desaturase/sphingolipid hydroxylase (fatty acid hydroxylase superfamily)